jgi:hypothetical protein
VRPGLADVLTKNDHVFPRPFPSGRAPGRRAVSAKAPPRKKPAAAAAAVATKATTAAVVEEAAPPAHRTRLRTRPSTQKR